MTDIDKYRQGYERGKADIANSRGEKLAEMPEKVVKGLIGLPGEAIRDFCRSSDEDRGYRDALDGKDFDPTCGGTGSVNYEHNTKDTTNSSFSNTNSPRQESYSSSSSGSSAESSDGSGFAQVIGWLIGVVIIIWVVLWLAVNIVLPIVLLNSAVALTILAVFIKQRKTLFATFALIGGCYMILDVVNGWFSANFVNNVVKNPQWLTGFVYLNATAVGISTWLLIEPQWAKAKAAEPRSKQRDNLWFGAVFAIVAVAGASLPLVYHNVSNPFSAAANKSTIAFPSAEVFKTAAEPTGVRYTPNEGSNFNASKYLGTWVGTGDHKEWMVDIGMDGDKIIISECKATSTEGLWYYGKYQNGKIVVDGYNEKRFYKFQIPSFEILGNGELLHSDGVGDIKLIKSNVSIRAVDRSYSLLNPINND